jgi:hypothetical protein
LALPEDLAQSEDDKVMRPHRFGIALGAQFPAAILEVPDKLLLLVSTDIVGCRAAWNALICALIYSNCALRSGWFVPSSVLLFACRLKRRRRSNHPTGF